MSQPLAQKRSQQIRGKYSKRQMKAESRNKLDSLKTCTKDDLDDLVPVNVHLHFRQTGAIEKLAQESGRSFGCILRQLVRSGLLELREL